MRAVAVGVVAALVLLATLPVADAVVFGAASSSGGTAAATTRSVNAPTGVGAGQLLLAQVVVEGGSGVGITPPAGWTLAKRTDVGTELAVAVYTRWAGAAEPASYTWTFSASQKSTIGLARYLDVDPATPLDAAVAAATADATSIAAPSVTTSTANALLVVLVASRASTTIAPPASMTERYDRNGAVTAESADQTLAGAGASGARTFTAAKKDKLVAHTLALRKAPEKVVSLDRASSSALEGAGVVRYLAQLNVASSLQVKVDYAVGGTASGGGVDHALAAGTLTFAPGQTVRWINATIVSDSLIEPDETLVLTLANPRNATLGAVAVATHTILNDDTSVAFASSGMRAAESDGVARAPVALAAPSAREVTVAYAVTGGSATPGVDATLAAGTLAFAPGQTTAELAIAIAQDDAREQDETLVVQLSSPTNTTLGAASAFTLTLGDDDPLAALALAGGQGPESLTAPSLLVSLSRATYEAVSVRYDVVAASAGAADVALASGTLALAPGARSGSIPLAVTNDLLDEPDESVLVRLRDPVNATLASSEATYVILDDDAQPAVAFASAGSAVPESGAPSLAVVLTAASGHEVRVDVEATGGTASADHALAATTLVFAPGETTRALLVPLVDDAVAEGDETLVLSLRAPANATLGAPATHTLVLLDDEAPVTVRFAEAAVSVPETAGAVVVRVVVSGANAEPVVVQYAVEPGATDAADVEAVAGNLTIAPGATSATLSVRILDDETPEPAETLTLRITGATGAPVAQDAHALTIVDDDPAFPSVEFERAEDDAAEAEGARSIAVALSFPYPREVRVAYDVAGGTATGGGVDYTLAAGTLAFAPGQTRALVPLALVDDALVEPTETITLQLRDPTRATLGARATHTLRVASDDLPPVEVRLVDAGTLVSEAVAAATVRVELSRASTSAVSVRYEALDGTARGGGIDYALDPGILVFTPGETTKTIRVELVDDGDIEPEETLVVGLTQPVGAILGAPVALTLRILSDDAADITVQFAAPSSSVAEGGALARIVVTLSAGSGDPIEVGYRLAGGTATAGADHHLAAGTLAFAPGATSATIEVPIVQDAAYEGDETLVLALHDAAGAVLGAQTTHTLALLDDDPAPQRELVVAPQPVTLAGAPDTAAWGGWSAEPGQTLVASTNYLKITNAGGVPNPTIVVSFSATGFVGAQDASHVVPIAGNLQLAWWEDTTPGASSPAEGTFTFADAGAGAVTIPFTGSGHVVYVAYRIVAMPGVLPPQPYQASFTVTEL